ncbi:MAG: J domain-containing protein [Clostridia bacterium]
MGINMKNYYDILEVNRRASKEVIEKAYKVLVKKYHPDLYTGEKQKYAEKKIKDINEAYDVLSDEFLKEQYDTELEKEIEEMYQKKYSVRNNFKEYQTNSENDINNSEFNKNNANKSNNEKNTEQEYNKKLGSFAGIVELTKELYKNKPKRDEFKKITQNDIIAVILTIIVVILIGIILWFIPFTNGWMREFLFENPLFNWIGNLFS